MAVSEDLLIRLKARVGDPLRLGGQEFRVVGVVVEEPDRMTGSFNVGPRMLISHAGLDRTGLIAIGHGPPATGRHHNAPTVNEGTTPDSTVAPSAGESNTPQA